MAEGIIIPVSLSTDKAKEDIKGLSGTLSTMLGSIRKLLPSLGIATAMLGIASATKSALNEFQALTDEIDKNSVRLGVSRKSYQEWRYIIGQCGGNIETLSVGMKTFKDVISGARQGTKTYTDMLSRLKKETGVTIDLSADAETQFNQVMGALAGMSDATEQSALATDLLGRSAIDLLPTLSQGKDGIESLRQRAHDLGLVMGDEAVDAGVALGDALSDLQQAIKTRFAPALTSVAQGLTKAINFSTSFGNVSATLRERVDALNSTMGQYKTVMDQLATSSDTLTVSQRNLLKAQADLLRAQAQAQMAGVVKAYDDYNKKIEDTAADYGMIHDRAEDYKAVLEAVNSGNRSYLNILLSTSKANDKVNGETSERTRRLEELTKELDAGYISGGRLLELEKYYIDDTNTLNKIDSERAGVLAIAKQSVIAIAQAYAAGLINIDGFKVANKALYDEIVKIADGFKAKQEAVEDSTDALSDNTASTEAAAQSTKNYSRAIAEQNITMLESGKRYEEAYQAKVRLIEQDKRAALEELATNNMLVASAEDVTKLTNDELVKRLFANKSTRQQLQDLNTYFLTQEVMARQSADEQIVSSYSGALGTMGERSKSFSDYLIDKVPNMTQFLADTFSGFVGSITSGMEAIGEALVQGEDGWAAFGKSGLNALAQVLEAFGSLLAAKAAAQYPNFPAMAMLGAASMAAYVAAGLIKGWANSFEDGGIVGADGKKRFESGGIVGGTGITGDKHMIWANAGEIILNAAQQHRLASALSSGGDTTAIAVNFNGQVFGDRSSIVRYVYEGIETAKRRGELR